MCIAFGALHVSRMESQIPKSRRFATGLRPDQKRNHVATPKFFQRIDPATARQQARMSDWTWEGARVLEWTGTVADLFPQIPVFSRHPFRVGSNENRFKDEIRREPLKITDEP